MGDRVFTFTCHPIISFPVDRLEFMKTGHAWQIDSEDVDGALDVFAKRASFWSQLNVRMVNLLSGSGDETSPNPPPVESDVAPFLNKLRRSLRHFEDQPATWFMSASLGCVFWSVIAVRTELTSEERKQRNLTKASEENQSFEDPLQGSMLELVRRALGRPNSDR